MRKKDFQNRRAVPVEPRRADEALRQSEEKLQMSESKYRNLIEFAPEAI